MIDTTEARALLREFGIEVVPANVQPMPGQTRAEVNVQRIINKRGMDNARMVVMTFAETQNNKAVIDEYTVWAMSDLIKAAEKNFPSLMTTDVEEWFKFFDGIPFGWIQRWSIDLDGITPKRGAIVGMIYERMKRVFGPLGKQPDLLDDRRMSA